MTITGAKITKIIELTNMTQVQFAESLGLSKTTLWRLQSSQKEIPIQYHKLISSLYSNIILNNLDKFKEYTLR